MPVFQCVAYDPKPLWQIAGTCMVALLPPPDVNSPDGTQFLVSGNCECYFIVPFPSTTYSFEGTGEFIFE